MKKKISIICLLFLNAFLFSQTALIPFSYEGKIGFVDEYFNLLFDPRFDLIKCIKKYGAHVYEKDTVYKDYLVFITGKEIEITTNIYSNPQENTGGLIDDEHYFLRQGDTDVNQVQIYSVFKKAPVKEMRNVYIQEHLGAVTSLQYMSVCNVSNSDMPRDNFVSTDGDYLLKPGVITKNGGAYFNADEGYGYYVDETYYPILCDNNGNTIGDKHWYGLKQISEGMVAGVNATEHGYFNMKGELVIPFVTSCWGIPDEPLPFFKHGIIPCVYENGIVRVVAEGESFESSQWAFIDKQGNPVVQNITATYISSFSDNGLAVLKRLKNGKTECVLINTEGNIVISTGFDTIEPAINGYCMATRNGIDYLICEKDLAVYRCEDFLN